MDRRAEARLEGYGGLRTRRDALRLKAPSLEALFAHAGVAIAVREHLLLAGLAMSGLLGLALRDEDADLDVVCGGLLGRESRKVFA